MPAFDGATWPRIIVLAGWGDRFDPGDDYLHLGTGPGLGTGKLGGTQFVDISADVRSVRVEGRGRSSEIDVASPATCTIVLGNASGAYDPTAINLLGAEDAGFEGGTVGGWVQGLGGSLSVTTGQAYAGTRSLTTTGDGTGVAVLVCDGNDQAAAVPVTPGELITLAAHTRAATTSRPWRLVARWLDADRAFLAQTNGTATANTTGWTEHVLEGATAPAGAAYVVIQVETTTALAAGEVHYLDELWLSRGGRMTAAAVDIGAQVRVRAELGGTVYERFVGTVTDIVMDAGHIDRHRDPTVTLTCVDGLELLGRTHLTELPPDAAAYDGDTTGRRIGHLLDEAGWPTALRDLDDGYTPLGPTVLGASALELARKTEQTEFGLLYVDGAGRVVFYDRHRATTATRSATVQAELTDTGAAGEVGMVEVSVSRATGRTYNDVHITRDPDPFGADQPAEQVAQHADSVARYGTLSLPAALGALHRDDHQALAMAQYLAERFGMPANRVDEVRINLLRGDAWATLLGLRLLDRISLRRDYGPNTVTMELLVQQMSEEISIVPPRWELRLSTMPPPPQPDLWVLGTSRIGTGRLGW